MVYYHYIKCISHYPSWMFVTQQRKIYENLIILINTITSMVKTTHLSFTMVYFIVRLCWFPLYTARYNIKHHLFKSTPIPLLTQNIPHLLHTSILSTPHTKATLETLLRSIILPNNQWFSCMIPHREVITLKMCSQITFPTNPKQYQSGFMRHPPPPLYQKPI